jgi:hypothetical protein
VGVGTGSRGKLDMGSHAVQPELCQGRRQVASAIYASRFEAAQLDGQKENIEDYKDV